MFNRNASKEIETNFRRGFLNWEWGLVPKLNPIGPWRRRCDGSRHWTPMRSTLEKPPPPAALGAAAVAGRPRAQPRWLVGGGGGSGVDMGL